MKKNNARIDYKELFKHMLDGLAHCKMIFDKQGYPVDFKFLIVNANFSKLTGMKNVVGEKVTDLIPGIRLSSPEMFEAYGRVATTGKSEVFELYVKQLKRWFLISVYGSKKGYFTAVFQNINSQKKVEKKLEDAKIAARNVLRDLMFEKEVLAHEKAIDEAMLASIADGVIIIDLEGKITFMNLSAQTSLGRKISAAIGKPFFDIVTIEDDKGQSALNNVKLARPMSGVYYYIRKDKTKFPASMTFSNVMLDGKIVGAIDVFRDITREKEIDRAKTEFVSLASHQLKTPPTAIKLLTERILKGRTGPISEKQAEYFQDIQTTNQRMIDLVNTLLSVSRIEMGTFSINPVLKNIPAILEEATKELKLEANGKNIIIEKIFSKLVPSVLIDEPLFHMVISNLLSNAINYTPKGGTVTVELRQVAKGENLGGKYVKQDCMGIIVSDTGVGIPKNQQDRIFMKFFRGDNARAKHTDGNGLGLYIVKSILGHSGGSIWFVSEENKGSVFYVAIPISGMSAAVAQKQFVLEK